MINLLWRSELRGNVIVMSSFCNQRLKILNNYNFVILITKL